jgi:hypothetical protein
MSPLWQFTHELVPSAEYLPAGHVVPFPEGDVEPAAVGKPQLHDPTFIIAPNPSHNSLQHTR